MLVLSRKHNEAVLIGENIAVTIVEIRGNKVRLGFTGPAGVRIDREEVRERIEAEQAEEARRNPTIVPQIDPLSARMEDQTPALPEERSHYGDC